jgi:hypothetical protein
LRIKEVVIMNTRERSMIVKKYFSTFLAGTLLATGFVSVAQA